MSLLARAPKILLFANTDWYLYNFRLDLARRLRVAGWQVVLVSPPGDYGAQLRALGFRWIALPFSTRSANPLHELGLLVRLIRLYRAERPDLVHHFTIKCVLYGSLAARLSGIPVVNAVTGLGHIFTDPGRKAYLLRPLVRLCYRLALGGRQVRTIFQNSDDRDHFIAWGLVTPDRTRMIRGSGVDLSRFSRKEQAGGEGEASAAATSPEESRPVKLLFASRLLREKGLFELLEAFRMLRQDLPQSELLVAGDVYPENPSTLTAQDIEEMRKYDGVTFLGHAGNMVDLLNAVDIVVLPSYREGTPRILLEAAAMELPIVATDIAGCRGLVEEGVNGLLVPPQSVAPLTAALGRLAADAQLRRRMGRAGRQIVLERFDEQRVNEQTMAVYAELVAPSDQS